MCCGHGQGSYHVYVEEKLVASGGEFEHTEATPFSIANMGPSSSIHPNSTPLYLPSSSPSTSIHPSSTPLYLPSSSPSTSIPPSSLVSLTPSFTSDVTFKLTFTSVSETSDHESICKAEFGNHYEVVDWYYDLVMSGMSDQEVRTIMEGLGIPISYNENYFFVTYKENKYYGATRVYFFEDHNYNPPGNWLVHDEFAGLSLGSWYNINGNILCKMSGSHISYSNTPSIVTYPSISLSPSFTSDVTFKLTSTYVSETSDHEYECKAEFGNHYEVVDWYYDLVMSGMSDQEVRTIMESLGIPISYNENGYFVTYKKNKYYSTIRVYNFEDHNYNPPGNWLVHDTFAGLSLGSWYNINCKVLCKKSGSHVSYSYVPSIATYPSPEPIFTFNITFDKFAETSNHHDACRAEFGESSTVADWYYDLVMSGMNEESMRSLIADLGIPISYNENSYFVTNYNKKYYLGSRVYFFEDHNYNPPGNWLVHDTFAGISLGSWFDIKGNVMCKILKTSSFSLYPSSTLAISSRSPSKFPTPSNEHSVLPSGVPNNKPFDIPSILPSIAKYDVPSDTPSSTPSADPSEAPFDVPSNVPSDIPSEVPTSIPSDVPSSISTRFPSDVPAIIPTNIPSDVPSEVPTIILSDVPSEVPTIIPSDVPSSVPTNFPSEVPSDIPSNTPSDIPSIRSDVPSSVPTNFPSEVASDIPSNIPSDIPSEVPTSIRSDVPSSVPTNFPSDVPSDILSNIPSDVPSEVPSSVPSHVPSDAPSGIPSQAPSYVPSPFPSQQPSDIPVVYPPDLPSFVPSMFPTDTPSLSDPPTLTPSISPSFIPSTFPSVNPSLSPSSPPSSQPSKSPSEPPSLSPSSKPSLSPSIRTSSKPSCSPSTLPTSIPSLLPSGKPSVVPSGFPTMVPSLAPSPNLPSAVATVQSSIVLDGINAESIDETNVNTIATSAEIGINDSLGVDQGTAIVTSVNGVPVGNVRPSLDQLDKLPISAKIISAVLIEFKLIVQVECESQAHCDDSMVSVQNIAAQASDDLGDSVNDGSLTERIVEAAVATGDTALAQATVPANSFVAEEPVVTIAVSSTSPSVTVSAKPSFIPSISPSAKPSFIPSTSPSAISPFIVTTVPSSAPSSSADTPLPSQIITLSPSSNSIVPTDQLAPSLPPIKACSKKHKRKCKKCKHEEIENCEKNCNYNFEEICFVNCPNSHKEKCKKCKNKKKLRCNKNCGYNADKKCPDSTVKCPFKHKRKCQKKLSRKMYKKCLKNCKFSFNSSPLP